MENKIKDFKTRQKEEAISRLEKLRVMPEVIEKFKKGELMYSERQNVILPATLYDFDEYANPMYHMKEKVDEWQKEHPDYLIYHLQLSYMECGALLSILFVTNTEEEWIYDTEDMASNLCFCYVLNLTYPECSEFGTIGIRGCCGGVVRIN